MGTFADGEERRRRRRPSRITLNARTTSALLPVLASGAVVLAAWTGVAALGPVWARAEAYVALWALAFAGYVVGARLSCRGRVEGRAALVVVLVVAALARALVLPHPVGDDVYRYVWEGRVTAAGGNPYVDPPAAGHLDALRRELPWSDAINHPEWTAIYPPAMTLGHAAVAAVSSRPPAMKLAFVAVEAALIALLLALLGARGLSLGRVVLYAWNPLAIHATALEGHHDVVAAAALLLLLVLLDRGRAALAGPALALAVLTKGFAVAAVPALARRLDARAWLGALLVAALAVAPFADAPGALASSLVRFGTELHYNDSIHALATWVAGPDAARWIVGALGLAFTAHVLRTRSDDPARDVARLLAALLVLLPTVHPWYLVVLLPLLALFPWPGYLAWTGSVAVIFLSWTEIRQTGQWTEWHAAKAVEYAPLFVWWAVLLVRRSRVACS